MILLILFTNISCINFILYIKLFYIKNIFLVFKKTQRVLYTHTFFSL